MTIEKLAESLGLGTTVSIPKTMAEWRAQYNPLLVAMPNLSGEYHFLCTSGSYNIATSGNTYAILARSMAAIERAYTRSLENVHDIDSFRPIKLYSIDVVTPTPSYLESLKDHIQDRLFNAMASWGIEQAINHVDNFGTVPDYVHICHNYNPTYNLSDIDEYRIDEHESCSNCGAGRRYRYSIDKLKTDQFIAEYWSSFYNGIASNQNSIFYKRCGSISKAHPASTREQIFAINDVSIDDIHSKGVADIEAASSCNVAFFCHARNLDIPDSIAHAYNERQKELLKVDDVRQSLMSGNIDDQTELINADRVSVLKNIDKIIVE